MINQVVMIGHLTRDPELKYLPSGTAVCKLSVALNSKHKGSDGQMVEEVSYIDVTAFGKVAEAAAEHLAKGRRVAVSGRLKQDRWQDEAGNNRSKVGVIAGQVVYLDRKAGGGGEDAPPPRHEGDDEEIPF